MPTEIALVVGVANHSHSHDLTFALLSFAAVAGTPIKPMSACPPGGVSMPWAYLMSAATDMRAAYRALAHER